MNTLLVLSLAVLTALWAPSRALALDDSTEPGIDITNGQVVFVPSEITAPVFCNGASCTWTWNAGAVDPDILFASGLVTFNISSDDINVDLRGTAGTLLYLDAGEMAVGVGGIPNALTTFQLFDAAPELSWTDLDTADGDRNVKILVNCTGLAASGEDCDVSFLAQSAGGDTNLLSFDADTGAGLADITYGQVDQVQYVIVAHRPDGAMRVQATSPTLGFDDTDGTAVSDVAFVVNCLATDNCGLELQVQTLGVTETVFEVQEVAANDHNIIIGDVSGTDTVTIQTTGDVTGTAALVLPGQSVSSGEVTNDTLTFAQISDSSAVDASTSFTQADLVTMTFTSAPAATQSTFTFNSTVADNDVINTVRVVRIGVGNNTNDGDAVRGLEIQQTDTAANGFVTGLVIDSAETTAGAMPDGIRITTGTADVISDGLDVSDPNITNAINIGVNPIALSGGSLSTSDLLILDDGAISGSEMANDTITATQVDETGDFAFQILSGKQDRANQVVNDNDCTGEQGFWWYDTTDLRFEFCDANAGAPTTLGGSGSFTAAGDAGTPQTISSGDTLTIAGDLSGIDTTAGATDTVTISFDPSEVGTVASPTVLWGAGTATKVWQFETGTADQVLTFGDGFMILESLATTGDVLFGDNTDVGMSWQWNAAGTGDMEIAFSDGLTAFNPGQLDVDVEISSTGDNPMFIVDAGANRVGVGLPVPTERFTVGSTGTAIIGITDLDTTDDDTSVSFTVNCPTTTTAAEDCDLSILQQRNGGTATILTATADTGGGNQSIGIGTQAATELVTFSNTSGGATGIIGAIPRFYFNDTIGGSALQDVAFEVNCLASNNCGIVLEVEGIGGTETVFEVQEVSLDDHNIIIGDVTGTDTIVLQVTGDTTGSAALVLPAQSVSGAEITNDTITPTQVDETADYSFTTLSGKQDRNNTAVNDNDCTGEQGLWWYDTTDLRFEFCDANTGTPAVLGGGGGGDNVTVNGVAATDVDLDDADPLAPTNGYNVHWQLNTTPAPDSVSAYFLTTDVNDTTFGNNTTNIDWVWDVVTRNDITMKVGDTGISQDNIAFANNAAADFSFFLRAGTGASRQIDFNWADAGTPKWVMRKTNTDNWNLVDFTTGGGGTNRIQATDAGAFNIRLGGTTEGGQSFTVNNNNNVVILTVNETLTDQLKLQDVGTVRLGLVDGDTTDKDTSVAFSANCTVTTTGAEDCDLTMLQQQNGSEVQILFADSDNGTTAGSIVWGSAVFTQYEIFNHSASGSVRVQSTAPIVGLDDSDGTALADVAFKGQCLQSNNCGLEITVQTEGIEETVFEVQEVTSADHNIIIGDTTGTDTMTLQVTGDITGTAALVVPTGSISGTEITNGTITTDDISTTAGTALLRECVYLDATSIVVPSSNGCELTTVTGTNATYRVCNFDQTTDESGFFAFGLPRNLAGSNATIEVTWVSNNAACDNGATRDVCWGVETNGAVNDGVWHSISLSSSQVVEDDRCIANGDLLTYLFAATITHGWTADGRAMVRIFRDADEDTTGCAAGEDDYAADASFLSLRLCYQVDTLASGEPG